MTSRFALLEIDVDLDQRMGKKKQEKPRNDDNGKRNQSKNNNNKKKKNDAKSKAKDLQAMAFGVGKPSKPKKKSTMPTPVTATATATATSPTSEANKDSKEGTVSPPPVNGSVDDDWKKRDEEFIRDENEKSLREALMLSKLDYEEKKDFYAQMKKEQVDESKGGKVKKKKDKPLTLSLDQFNNLPLEQLSGMKAPVVPEQQSQTSPQPAEDDASFFDDLDDVTKKTLDKESRHENYQATASQFSSEVRASQYEAEIEKRDFEIQALRLEVKALKDELLTVKTRNKKLCEVICSAEMKAKAELVVELDKITKVREELTQELSNLSAQLEQERSKVNQLTLDLKKSQGKKKQNTDTSMRES